MIPGPIKHLKFLKVLKNSKKAFEEEWQNRPECWHSEEEISEWRKTGGNYGVICGSITGLSVIDCDHEKYIKLVEEGLPKTFSVRSSSDKKRHFYYSINNWPEGKQKFSLENPDNPEDSSMQGGDFRHGNFYIMGPGSIHPDTKQPYTVVDDFSIAKIDFKDIDAIFKPFYKKKKIISDKLSRSKSPLSLAMLVEHYKIPITKRNSQHEFSVCHPIHGSNTGGTNLGMNDDRNQWYCRRCDSGGNAIHFVAMMEGFINCDQLPEGMTDEIRQKTLSHVKKVFGIDLYYEVFAPLNDAYNAHIFYRQNQKALKYCSTFQGWYSYNGQIWERDDTAIVKKKTFAVYQKLLNETPAWVPTITEKDSKETIKEKHALIKSWSGHVRNSGEASKLDNIAIVAQKDMTIRESDFDQDDNLICLKNGVFDLKKFELLPFDYHHLLTRQALFHYDKDAKCLNWNRFLNIVFINDEKLIRFFQQIMGYCLTADISKQIFCILHGGGRNGKSTLIDTIKYGMGTYAAVLRSQSLLVKKDDAIPNDWAALRKMRMVVAGELETSKNLDISIVKQFTSKKPMQVRFLNHEFFEMKPTFKVFLETNSLPVIKGDDDGTWGRIKKIPFNYKFADKDIVGNYAEEFLYPELSGILNWMIAGLKDLNENGLIEPDAVTLSTGDYREDENTLNDFIQRHCYPVGEAKGHYILSSDLWSYYKKIMQHEGETLCGKRNFPALIAGYGINRDRVTSGPHKGLYAYWDIKCKTTTIEYDFRGNVCGRIETPNAHAYQ